MEVARLREGYNEMHHDIHGMFGRTESIEEAETCFRGYVERQEERVMMRIQLEDEQAMREAQEYEERRRMNELVWLQSEATHQLE